MSNTSIDAGVGRQVPDIDETITAVQRRHMFEELIGATREKSHSLWWSLDRLIVAHQDERDEVNDREVANLCRHFPGLESVMLLVWEHHIRAGGDRQAPYSPCQICEPAPSEGAS